jgi:hypothetical protein
VLVVLRLTHPKIHLSCSAVRNLKRASAFKMIN